MNIEKTFLKLTEKTYPHGTEAELEKYLPKNIQKDNWGNYFLEIGDSDTMFTCHLDTCCYHQSIVKHVKQDNFIQTDGSSILGADDKAGMTVLLYMIEKKVPGLYYFFVGEEVGGVGSSKASAGDFSKYKKCVSFDRRGYNSIITDQFYGVCCSDEFAEALASELNNADSTFRFSPDPTGMFTDSANFVYDINECTNISVGYFSEHQTHEKQDIRFLERLCKAVVKVNWNNLPIVRELRNYQYVPKQYIELEESEVITVYIDGEKWETKLSPERLSYEKEIISDWITSMVQYDRISWDGKRCFAGAEYIGNRNDFTDVIEELEHIPVDDLILIRKI